jgi:hypothetical protein
MANLNAKRASDNELWRAGYSAAFAESLPSCVESSTLLDMSLPLGWIGGNRRLTIEDVYIVKI